MCSHIGATWSLSQKSGKAQTWSLSRRQNQTVPNYSDHLHRHHAMVESLLFAIILQNNSEEELRVALCYKARAELCSSALTTTSAGARVGVMPGDVPTISVSALHCPRNISILGERTAHSRPLTKDRGETQILPGFGCWCPFWAGLHCEGPFCHRC